MNAEWLHAYQAQLGPLPEHYLVVDTETTGLDPQKDYILQIGWCEVRFGKVVSNDEEILNWTDHPGVDRHWLAARMDGARRSIESDGGHYPWTLDLLRAEGVDPIDSLSLLFNRMLEWDNEGLPIAGHNFVRYDAAVLHEAGHRHLGYPYRPDDRRVIDTAGLEKAQLLGMVPVAEETPGQFFRRALAARAAGVFYKLSTCIRRHGLDQKHALNMEQAHRAAFDCLMCHHLLENYRHESHAALTEVATGV